VRGRSPIHPTVTELGLLPYAAPLSCVGFGGCSGTHLTAAESAARLHQLTAPSRPQDADALDAAAGPKVPSVRAPPAARLPRTAAGRAMRGAALAGALSERLRYSGPAPCPLRDADGKRSTQDGTFHLFCECTHPAVQAERHALQSTLPALLERLTTLICKALRAQTAPAETSQRVSELRDTFLALAVTRDALPRQPVPSRQPLR